MIPHSPEFQVFLISLESNQLACTRRRHIESGVGGDLWWSFQTRLGILESDGKPRQWAGRRGTTTSQ